jgi:catechol 2,3-dioxygenase-like lactoylglutathione lyase family enzyme
MIGYTTVGTNDIERAAGFYDALFETLGAKRLFDSPTFIAWGRDLKSPSFAVARPYDGKPATVGNGVMIAIAMRDPADVDAFHARALELGGSDEGAPGDRGGRFYAGYFRDPEGNKLNAFCWTHD